MKYLILFENKAFYTEYFDEDKYLEGMAVFNLYENVFTEDGETWNVIDYDNL